MSLKKDDAVRLARVVARFLNALSTDNVDALLAGNAELQVVAKDAGSRSQAARHGGPEEGALLALLQYLHSAPNREAGFEKLEQDAPRKADLEALARLADLPVLRRNTVRDLRERIVEATIGYRLRSQAVKGEQQK